MQTKEMETEKKTKIIALYNNVLQTTAPLSTKAVILPTENESSV